MNEHKGTIDAIEIAMDAELKASQYYKDATKKVISEKGKNLLEDSW